MCCNGSRVLRNYHSINLSICIPCLFRSTVFFLDLIILCSTVSQSDSFLCCWRVAGDGKGCFVVLPVLCSCSSVLKLLTGGGYLVAGDFYSSLLSHFLDRSQDSIAVVLSDSSSTQDTFTEPASSQDSTKRLFLEKRSNYSHSTIHYKDVQTHTDERGKLSLKNKTVYLCNFGLYHKKGGV